MSCITITSVLSWFALTNFISRNSPDAAVVALGEEGPLSESNGTRCFGRFLPFINQLKNLYDLFHSIEKVK